MLSLYQHVDGGVLRGEPESGVDCEFEVARGYLLLGAAKDRTCYGSMNLCLNELVLSRNVRTNFRFHPPRMSMTITTTL